MLRIAFIIDKVLSDRAGTEQQLLSLIKSLNKDNFEVFLCCLQRSDFLDSINFCTVKIFEIKSFKSIQFFRSALSFITFLKSNQIDIVQTHFKDSNVFGVFCAKIAGVPLILSARRGEPYWDDFFGKLLTQITNYFTDRFIVNSHSIEKFLIDHEGVNAQSIHVFSNSMDLERMERGLSCSQRFCREQLGFRSNDFIVGIVANLRPIKRHDVFIEAASHLCRINKDWRFIIVGTGFLEDDLRKQVRRFGIEEHFSFLGLRNDVPQIIKAFDVGVLCSDHESTSNTVLEYIAMGIPVVCSDVGDLPHFIEETGNGYLFAPGDSESLASALLRIRNGFFSKDCLKRKSDLVVKNCDIRNVVTQYETSYREYYNNAI